MAGSSHNELVDIEGTKTWVDNSNELDTRPNEITVRLYANGVEVDSATISLSDKWEYSFTDLRKYDDNGDEIVYTITEDSVDGYTAEIRGYDIVNTYNADETYGLGINKVNQNEETLDGAEFTLTDGEGNTVLFETGLDVSGEYDAVFTVSEQGSVSVITAGNIYINRLPAGIYTLTETTAPTGYKRLKEDIEVTVSESGITINETDNATANDNVITVVNNPLFTLPEAGSGMFWFWLAALSVTFGLIGSSIAGVRSSRKRYP